MNIPSKLWRQFAKSKKFREEFVAAQVKRGIPFQARVLLNNRKNWTQQTLAEKANLTQGVVSRALDPNYGNLTLNTIIRIAAGFDVAFIGRFVPFSQLRDWFENMSEEADQVVSFEEENELIYGSDSSITSIGRFPGEESNAQSGGPNDVTDGLRVLQSQALQKVNLSRQRNSGQDMCGPSKAIYPAA